MDFGLIQKHEAFIKERWLPISVEFMLQEGQEKKISFLKEAQPAGLKGNSEHRRKKCLH